MLGSIVNTGAIAPATGRQSRDVTYVSNGLMSYTPAVELGEEFPATPADFAKLVA